ncbi:hypothetical protein LG200_04415 [Methylobacillus caricis]|uniref:hypothetical protein n=1 Tax=Methylobacillus caricis TaxID=1971611 RepID=UPI001CFFEB90|nr:hypothetical protein [Methylobacillus caricis]MCB5187249.1 hypothetical protein [Methylobacillus caricis]
MSMTLSQAISALGDPNSQTIEGLKQLVAQVSVQVSNQTNNAVTLLYSGAVGDVPAWKIANQIGSSGGDNIVIIDKTPVAEFLNSPDFKAALQRAAGTTDDAIINQLFDGIINSDGSRTPGMWDIASANLAHAASGEVRTLTPLAEMGKTFIQTELPALCFIWTVEPQLCGKYGLIPPRESGEISREDALERAAMLGHPQCMGDLGSFNYVNDPVKRAEWNLKGAKKGCKQCQTRLATFYRHGMGTSINQALSWCWVTEAAKGADIADLIADLILSENSIWPLLTDRPLLTLYRPNTNCEVIEQVNVPFEPDNMIKDLKNSYIH